MRLGFLPHLPTPAECQDERQRLRPRKNPCPCRFRQGEAAHLGPAAEVGAVPRLAVAEHARSALAHERPQAMQSGTPVRPVSAGSTKYGQYPPSRHGRSGGGGFRPPLISQNTTVSVRPRPSEWSRSQWQTIFADGVLKHAAPADGRLRCGGESERRSSRDGESRNGMAIAAWVWSRSRASGESGASRRQQPTR